MNIFVTNLDPVLAAKDLCDKHICKMSLETCQVLCSVHWVGWQKVLAPPAELRGKKLKEWLAANIPDPSLVPPYSMTHVNHPCSVWARQTPENYAWLAEHGLGLCHEYTARYGKTIKSETVTQWAIDTPPPTWASTGTGLTPFALAMPEEYKVPGDPVQSYRNYYLGSKVRFAKWRHGPEPSWWKPGSL